MFYAAARLRPKRNFPNRKGVIEANRLHKESDDMKTIRNLLKLNSDKRAVTALEYGMIAALIAVVVIGGFTTLGHSLSTTINTVNSAF
jgi:pilus assembly protein Flp/PilA